MNSFWRIFSLEFTAAVRSKSLILLLVASLSWMFAVPFLFVGDGTDAGNRAIALHYSLGGVAALLVVTLLASATGAIARERAAKRLQLTLVRPVRHTVIALAKTAALVFVGALVLAAATVVEACRSDLSRICRHVISPVMPTPQEEAAILYDAFIKDPSTPAPVRRAKKSVVLRLLAQRSLDRYDTVGTNDTIRWTFKLGDGTTPQSLSVRLRFTNAYDVRDDVRGDLELRVGEDLWHGAVTNITQAIVEIPLQRVYPSEPEADNIRLAKNYAELKFRNCGKSPLMLRPRRDVNLLVPADGFGWNLLRAYVELVAMLSLLVAFGVFLGAGLGRPVALFTAIVALAVSEMSPSVIEQYPDELETDRIDAIGLYITRAAAEATHPVSSLEPLAKLSEDVCVERREVVRTAVVNILLVPLALSLLSALVIPRKIEA